MVEVSDRLVAIGGDVMGLTAANGRARDVRFIAA
jgi:hypothetical protein